MVTVVGSCNFDQVVFVPELPSPGQTIYGTKYITGFGGKGANQVCSANLCHDVNDFLLNELKFFFQQAVMASLMGATVHMVGKLGDDDIGRSTLKNFKDRGVNTDFVGISPGSASGVAAISVITGGQNSIVIAPGANILLDKNDLDMAKEVIMGCKVLLCQNEVHPDTTLAAMQMAKGKGPLVGYSRIILF
jgi:ribokinase